MNGPGRRGPLEWWGGVECTVNRVGDRWFDQLVWSGHDRRPDDLDRFAALGITALRYPVLWERLAPSRLDEVDWRWTDERLHRLRALNLRPIAGLVHHGSGPRYTSLLDPEFPAKLASFAGAVARRYPWLRDFTPVNEPLTTARFSALYGHWYPHLTSERAFVRALVNQLRGIVLSMRSIRAVIPDARLVQTEDCGKTFGDEGAQAQVAHDNHRRWLTYDLLTGSVTSGHPFYPHLRSAGFTDDDEAFFRDHVCPPDVVGLNYYLTSDRFLDTRIERYPPRYIGGNGSLAYADVEAVRGHAGGIVGYEQHLLEAWSRYRRPVALTEVHLACTREEQMRWLAEAWHGALQAREKGAEVRAVTAWALLGAYNWDSLVTVDADHYEPGAFDIRSPSPRATAVAELIKTAATSPERISPLANATGWWRRPDRMIHGAHRGRTTTVSPGRPLLTIGATGTLGRAFHHIAVLRGLPSLLLGRSDIDITDATVIDSAIRRLQPWAVINAAGFVRVDDAERDAESCFRINAGGAANLAAACRRRGLPLVTYSSDLVFDGAKGAPYDESDVPHPLNVYGASKLDAEQHTLTLLPEALVIRTSAFFGPWDDHNFLAHLFQALDRGRTFLAAGDAVVSPTYVPDLVNASLDLLIDGERGIWHVANQGAISWYEFAVAAAASSGRATDRIVAVPLTEVSGPAPRPAFSALTSCRGRLLRSTLSALDAFNAAMRERADVEQQCASR